MNHTKKQSQLWQHYPALKQSRYQDLNEHFGITLRNNRNWGSTIPTLTKSRRLGFLFSILLTVLSFWDLLSILLYLKKKNNLHKEESLQSFQNISWLFCSIFQFLNQLYQQEVSSVAFICSLLVRIPTYWQHQKPFQNLFWKLHVSYPCLAEKSNLVFSPQTVYSALIVWIPPWRNARRSFVQKEKSALHRIFFQFLEVNIFVHFHSIKLNSIFTFKTVLHKFVMSQG